MAWYLREKRSLGRSRQYSLELIYRFVVAHPGCSRVDIARHLELRVDTPHLRSLVNECVLSGLICVRPDTKFYPYVMRYFSAELGS